MRTDRFYSIAAALPIVACVLATIPVLEMGVNDDWSYAYIARGVALSGRFAYTGWSQPIVGVQALWAALLIRLFGFSFTLVRLSTLPFAAGCGLVLYRLGRLAGLKRDFALFGSASLTLSPLFIPLAASFMTDIPSLFFWLACMYCALRAAGVANAVRACAWMAAAAALGVAGGTVRQVVWVAPLLALPAVAWFRRRERPVVVSGALLWCASAAAAALCLRWFLAQPYAGSGMEAGADGWPHVLQDAAEWMVQLIVTGLLFALPAASILLAGWRKALRAPSSLALGLAFTILVGTLLWWFGDDLLLGNIVTANGMLYSGTEALGSRPEILTATVCGVLKFVLAVTGTVTAATLFENLRSRRWETAPDSHPAVDRDAPSLRPFAFVFLPPCLAYAAAVFYRGILFDRYLLLLLPALIIPLLRHCQRKVRDAVPAAAWMVAGLFALYGIATTHDYLAAGRARLQAASALTAAGIPRTSITAGLEYDGWTELEHSGHIADADFPDEDAEDSGAPQPGRRYPVSPPFWFWAKTPSIDPVYIVAYSRLPELRDAAFAPVGYRAWLPPFHRQVFTQVARR